MYGLANDVRSYLLANKHSLELPFIHAFPFNCCEISSIILAHAYLKFHPDYDVVFVSGYDKNSDAWHFWLEVNSFVIDITANQYEEIGEPIYGIQDALIISKFKDIEKEIAKTKLENHYMYQDNYDEIFNIYAQIT